MTADEYSRRANLHRPQTLAENRAAAMELLRSGLSDGDVAHILGASVEQVRRLIGRPP